MKIILILFVCLLSAYLGIKISPSPLISWWLGVLTPIFIIGINILFD